MRAWLAVGMPGRLFKCFFSEASIGLTLSRLAPSLFSFLSLHVLLMIPINLELLGFPISQSELAICAAEKVALFFFIHGFFWPNQTWVEFARQNCAFYTSL